MTFSQIKKCMPRFLANAAKNRDFSPDMMIFVWLQFYTIVWQFLLYDNLTTNQSKLCNAIERFERLAEGISICTRCGHVVRDFESEAKTRCSFQFWLARRHWFNEIFKNDNVQGLRSKFRKIVIDPLFFGQRIVKGYFFISKLKEI